MKNIYNHSENGFYLVQGIHPIDGRVPKYPKGKVSNISSTKVYTPFQFIPQSSTMNSRLYFVPINRNFKDFSSSKGDFLNPWTKRKYKDSDKYYLIPKQTVNVFYNDYISDKIFYEIYSMKTMFINRHNKMIKDRIHRENLYFVPYGMYEDKNAILNFIYGEMESLWNQLFKLEYSVLREIPYCTKYQGLVSDVRVDNIHVEFRSETSMGVIEDFVDEYIDDTDIWSIDSNFGYHQDLNMAMELYRTQIGYRTNFRKEPSLL